MKSAALAQTRGAALVAAIMTMMLMCAMGAALALNAAAAMSVAAAFRSGEQAFYAADGGLERALADLRALPDWSIALNGAARSTFGDGPPAGLRRLPDGTSIDVDQLLSFANCGAAIGCSTGATAASEDRPASFNSPGWQPFADGPVGDLLPGGSIRSPFYVVVMVRGDQVVAGQDSHQEAGASAESRPDELIELRSEAFGPFGTHRVLVMTLARDRIIDPDTRAPLRTIVRVRSWREIRKSLP
jgi:hypothetical protein